MAAKKFDEYISASTVAKILGKKTRTIQQWIKEGKLEAHELFGRYLIEKSYFEEWQKRNVQPVK